MRRIVFPPVETATEDGLVAIGGDLAVDTLETAYRQGIFPWPLSVEFPLAWFSPDPRGILPFDELHIPRSLKKTQRQQRWEIKHDHSFLEIIRLCATVARKGQHSTWITPEIIHGYAELFHRGNAWCTGVWQGQRLVGGVYGVRFEGFRSGESMFTLEDGAGKTALVSAIERFRVEGVRWMDTQMVTPVVKSLGGREVPRDEFLEMLGKVLKR